MHIQEIVLLSIAAVAISPVVATVIEFFKSLLTQLWKAVGGFFVVTMKLDNEQISSIVIGYLRKNAWHLPMGDDYYSHSQGTFKGKPKSVFYKNVTKSLNLFIYRKVPLMVTPFVDKGASSENKRTTIHYIRGTLNVKRLLQEAGEAYDNWSDHNGSRRFQVIHISGGSKRDEDKFAHNQSGSSTERTYMGGKERINVFEEPIEEMERESAYGKLSLTAAHTKLMHDVKFWLEHQNWYQNRNLSWKRGYLLYGPPGNGKTSLIRALCEDLDIPIVIMDLTGMTNNQFRAAWEWVRSVRPRAVVLEDFDTVFQGRHNCSKLGMLDFGTVLNAVDGIQQEHGMLLFVTTNKPEMIDEALGKPLPDGSTTRPGRLDVAVQIPPLDIVGLTKIAEQIVDDPADAAELASQFIKFDGRSPAQFIEKCKQFALQQLWDKAKQQDPTDEGSMRSNGVFDILPPADPPETIYKTEPL